MPLDDDRRPGLVEGVRGKVLGLPRFRRRDLAERLGLAQHSDLTDYGTVEQLEDEVLFELAEHFDVETPHSNVWPLPGLRLFVSHVADARRQFEGLRAAFATFGINFFLAHDNIEEGAEWRGALLQALDSMDAMLTVHSAGFQQSVWTNQEAGYALARKVPIGPIMNGEAPCGFLNPIQGFRWRAGEERALAERVLEMLNEADAIPAKLGEALAKALKSVGSFAQSDAIIARLNDCREITDEAARQIDLAFRFNDQVYNSGAGNNLSALLARFGKALDQDR